MAAEYAEFAMAYQHLTHNIPAIRLTAYLDSFLITVPNSHAAAIVLERAIKYNVRTKSANYTAQISPCQVSVCSAV